jgi:TPR repeat protein
MMLALIAVSAVCGIIWGGMTVYKQFSSTINQQVLSETLALAHYTPATTSVSEFAIPRLDHSNGKDENTGPESAASIPPSDLPPVTEASTAEDAIARGDQARVSRQFAIAVAWYMRAQEIDPLSAPAKESIVRTLEAWVSSDGPGIQTQPVADVVEQASVFSSEASRLLADYYLERDRDEGLRWLQRSAEAGYPRHQVILGLIFARGQIVPQELNFATRWFQRAANKGDVDGEFHFGECLILGEGINRDAPRGIDFLERAARAGDARAQELLGICYAKGDGVNPDGNRAKEYFEQAVEGGSVSAYYNLAVRYAKGHGVAKDEALAARIFLKGAEKGNIPCMYAFGRCIETGFGIEKSLEQAKVWLTKAAHLGDIEAQAWCANNEVPFDKPAELLSGF